MKLGLPIVKGGGWAPVPHSRHGGQRRRKAGGGWEYRYPEGKAPLYHSTSHAAMEQIREHGLKPRAGGGVFSHGGYAEHSQGKTFLSAHPEAASTWHGKVADQLQHHFGDDEPTKQVPVMLRVKHRKTERDTVGDNDVSGSRMTTAHIPPEDIEFYHPGEGWRDVGEWDEDSAHLGVSHHEEEDGDRWAVLHDEHGPKGFRAHAAESYHGGNVSDREAHAAAEARKRAAAEAAAKPKPEPPQGDPMAGVRNKMRDQHWPTRKETVQKLLSGEIKQLPIGMRGGKINRMWRTALMVNSHGEPKDGYPWGADPPEVAKAGRPGIRLQPPPEPNRKEHPYQAIANYQGVLVFVENKKGTTRSGTGKDGKKWSIRMKAHYGEIPGTNGSDGDPIDVYIGPSAAAPYAYIIHQKHLIGDEECPPLSYDEDKVMLGYDTKEAALRSWASHFDRPVFTPGVTIMHIEDLKARVYSEEATWGGGLVKGGPYIGPRGGKYADPQHKIPWKERKERTKQGKHVHLSKSQLDHLLTKGNFSLISAGRNPAHPEEGKLPEDHPMFAERHEQLKRDIAAAGYDHTEVEGHYGGKEKTLVVLHPHAQGTLIPRVRKDKQHSMIVHHPDEPSHYAKIRELGAKHNQDSVVHSRAGTHELHYTVGEKAGQHHKGTGHEELPHADDYYTRIEHAGGGATKFSLHFDWDQTHGMDHALLKSWPPKGGGWHPIPGGKRGGYRRKKGANFEYAYPDQKEPHHHPKWERDPGKTAADLKPGDLVEVGGRSGHYRYTPDHAAVEGEAPSGTVWVTSESTGEHEFVRESTVFPIRPAKKRRKPPPPPPGPRGGKKRQRGREGTAGTWTGPVSGSEPKLPPTPPQGYEQPGEGQRMAEPYADTEWEPGTVLHDLESGKWPLISIKHSAARGERYQWSIYVPKHRQNEIVMHPEVQKRLKSVVRQMLRRFHLPAGDSVQAEQVRAGALTGLVMALRNYTGGKPFLASATHYMRLGAIREARHEQGGTTIPDRVMRNVGTYLAARAQARQASGGKEPTREQIAKQWRVKKKHVFWGDLGRYTTKGKDGTDVVRDQGNEEVPFGPWKIRTPEGKEAGPAREGKLALMDAYDKLMRGDKVEDSEWMGEHGLDILPQHDAAAMPMGTAFHMRMELESILQRMKPEHRTVLSMKWGLHGEGGVEASAQEIADALGISGSEATVRRQVKKLLDSATEHAKRIAKNENMEIASQISKWSHMADHVPGHITFTYGPMFPSHTELREQFGSDQNVRMYQAAIRGGWADRAKGVLERKQAGKATAAELEQLDRDFHAQIDKERLAAFKRHKAEMVEPEEAREWGPQGRSPYDAVAFDYYTTAAKGG